MITKRKVIDRHKEARDNEITGRNEIKTMSTIAEKRKRARYKLVTKESTAQRNNGQKITRNVSHFKKIKKPEDETDDECSDYSKRVPAENQLRNNHHVNGNDAGLRRPSQNRRPPERYGHECPSNLIK